MVNYVIFLALNLQTCEQVPSGKLMLHSIASVCQLCRRTSHDNLPLCSLDDALLKAAEGNDTNLAIHLLDDDANANIHDVRGFTPLMFAGEN